MDVYLKNELLYNRQNMLIGDAVMLRWKQHILEIRVGMANEQNKHDKDILYSVVKFHAIILLALLIVSVKLYVECLFTVILSQSYTMMSIWIFAQTIILIAIHTIINNGSN